MHQGPETGAGDVPLATEVIGELDGLDRAQVKADPAPFTEEGIYDKSVAYGPEAAPFQTFTALDTLVRVNERLVTRKEIVSFQNLGIEE
jgi:hypothetical protein